jgi:hypothetical protein
VPTKVSLIKEFVGSKNEERKAALAKVICARNTDTTWSVAFDVVPDEEEEHY